MLVYFNKFDEVSEKTYKKMYDILPVSRKQKVDEIKIEKNKKIAIIEYFLVKKYLNMKKYCDFLYTKGGKPYIAGYSKFNISHSENMLVVAVRDNEVGVDVQKIVKYNEKLANKICNKEELKKLNNSTDKDLTFTEIWTLKESYLKLKDLGIYMDLKKIPQNNNFRYNYFYIDGYVVCECFDV